MTELLPATPEQIAYAADILRRGGLVAFPTETVYGLGANAFDEQAVQRIFAAKGRPASDPLIVHLSKAEQLELVACSFPDIVHTLAGKFWPGPLTLVLPKRENISDAITAGLPTVAVRVPAHPIALALIEAAQVPVAAPSANRFGHTSPTTASHVWHDLAGRIDLILDGGPTSLGVESTVLDVVSTPPRILRPGGVTREMLEEVLGPVSLLVPSKNRSDSLPSPGLLEKHYAPHARLLLFTGDNALALMAKEAQAARQAGQKVGALALDEQADFLEQHGLLVYRLGHDVNSAARLIYAGMRWLDRQHVDVILCCDFPESGLGLAVRDRLRRAASKIIHQD